MKSIAHKIFNNFLNAISNVIFPVKCALCKVDGEYLCILCESKLDLNYVLGKNKQKIYGPVNNIGKENWIYAKYKYQNYNLKKLEYKIKYNHHPELAEIMGQYSCEFIRKNIISKNISQNIYLVSIPISKNRLRERGYNQTEYITKGIQNGFIKENIENNTKTNIQILDILNRQSTKKLKDIYGVDNRSEEIRNSINVDELKLKDFLLVNKIEINNLNLEENMFILIDDITTSGATFYEARRVLTHYGIVEKKIYGYAITH